MFINKVKSIDTYPNKNYYFSFKTYRYNCMIKLDCIYILFANRKNKSQNSLLYIDSIL